MGCSGFRDSRLGKFHNNMTARYNGYFNANESIKEGLLEYNQANPKDYSEIISVFTVPDEET
ncbi:MAG: hypothetical protein ACPGLV_05670, partial [Bacteroidia bacterium]